MSTPIPLVPHASPRHEAACAGVLLIKAVQQWHEEHRSALPGSAKEKAAFRSMLKSWQRSIDGVPLEVPWRSNPTGPSCAVHSDRAPTDPADRQAWCAGGELWGGHQQCAQAIQPAFHPCATCSP